MGAVCSAGFSDQDTKNLGFSGKLKKSVNGLKDNFSFSDEIDALRTPHKYDSGELRSSFSSELKSSTPARSGAAKVIQSKVKFATCIMHRIILVCFIRIGILIFFVVEF